MRLLFALLLCAAVCMAAEMCSSKNVTISETLLDSAVKELQWVGERYELLFVVTVGGGLYRSKDGGATWADQLPFLEGATDPEISAVTGVASLVVTSDSSKLYVVGHGMRVWVSTSGGNAYKPIDLPEVLVKVKVHPAKSQSEWALLQTASARCYDPRADGVCKSSLYVTKDLLKSKPELLSRDVRQYAWGDGIRIYASTWEESDDTTHTWRRDSSTLALRYTDEPAAPYVLTTLKPACAGFVVAGNALWVAAYSPSGGRALELHYGANMGQSPLEHLEFPTMLDEARYTICHVEPTAMFINVQHNDLGWGNLYVTSGNATLVPQQGSDPLAPEVLVKHAFSLSLERAVRYPTGTVEFAKFVGLPGTFISNIREDSGDDERAEETMTVITYDNGGEWHTLAPPTVVTAGTPTCAGVFCHLHLHGLKKKRLHRDRYAPQEFGPLHTKRNAVGLALATGNVGDALSDDYVGVFLSRDGGHRWAEVANGSHTYDFADHGALMLLVSNFGRTDTLRWSWDEFYTSSDCRMVSNATVAFLAHDVVADPAAVGERAIVHGVDEDSGAGYLIHLDFASLHERACTADDYEIWSPSSDEGSNCLLGETFGYKRRRRTAACYNDEVLEPTPTSKPCKCSRADYACDECYEPLPSRDFKSEHCVRNDACFKLLYPNDTERAVALGEFPPLDCEGRYAVTRGYAMVEGTKCELDGGIDLLPELRECPKRLDSGGGAGTVVLLVLLTLVAVGVLAGVVFVWRRRSLAPPSLEYATLDDNEGAALGAESISDEEDGAVVLSDDDIDRARDSATATGDDDQFNPRS